MTLLFLSYFISAQDSGLGGGAIVPAVCADVSVESEPPSVAEVFAGGISLGVVSSVGAVSAISVSDVIAVICGADEGAGAFSFLLQAKIAVDIMIMQKSAKIFFIE
jgi:hypothetical protein